VTCPLPALTQQFSQHKRNQNKRPGRLIHHHRQDHDTTILQSYGSDFRHKDEQSVRFFFQNVKGLTYSTSCEDYEYYLHHLKLLQVDVAGLAETNSPWQLQHIKSEFLKRAKKYSTISKTVFGSVHPSIDPVSSTDKFQAGGCITMIQGNWTTAVQRDEINDPSGLGRWAGFTLSGKTRARCL
jgi:hypothetical protein